MKIQAVVIKGEVYVEMKDYVELLEAYRHLSENQGKILVPFGTELECIPRHSLIIKDTKIE
jgi:hypothetical protein